MLVGGIVMIKVVVNLAMRQTKFWKDLSQNVCFVHQSQYFFGGFIFQNGEKKTPYFFCICKLCVNEIFAQPHLSLEFKVRKDLMLFAKL